MKLPNVNREEWMAAIHRTIKRLDDPLVGGHATVKLCLAVEDLIAEINEADFRDFSTGPAYDLVVAILKEMRGAP